MNLKDVKKEIKCDSKYDFLRNGEYSDKLIFLTLAGSYSYGTNIDTKEHLSDIDLRGVYTPSLDELLSMRSNSDSDEVYVDEETDTVLYSLPKIIKLLTKCNPSVIEMFGTKDEHIIYCSEMGKLIRDNIDLFLTKRAYYSFCGYANAQLRRLQNGLSTKDTYSQEEKERYILDCLRFKIECFEDEFNDDLVNKIQLNLLDSSKKDMSKEIFMNINLENYPLRDFDKIYSEIKNIMKDFDKLNHRNRKKDELHLNKHSMHLIRLLLTGKDILDGKGINTFREADREFLLDIRNGKYSYDEIFNIVDKLNKDIKKSFENSKLPDRPDLEKVNELIKKINMNTVLKSIA